MHSPSLNYRPDIDGLRAVAVLSVVVHHLREPWLPGGFVGVDVFFVISGYLITTIILREMAEGRFTFRRFYERRARRIFPALFSVLAATLVGAYFLLLPTDFVATSRAALGTLAFASNILFWRLEGGYFEGTDSKLNPLLHTWSLAVEEQFYVLFPIVLLIGFRYVRHWLFKLFVLASLLSLAAAAVLVERNASIVFYLLPFRAWELLAGALLAFGTMAVPRSRLLREAMAGLGLVAVVGACVFYTPGVLFPGVSALAPVLGAAAIIHAGAGGPTLTGRLLTLRPMVYVGLISYSLYLWHWPLLVFVDYHSGMEPPGIGALLAVLAASLLLSSASYHWIERPFRFGRTRDARWALPSAAGFAAVAAAFSVAALMSAGFAGRFDRQVLSLDQARTPVVPFQKCDDRAPHDACLLGDARRAPDMLLWGDSHLMAWAPALHAGLKQTGRSAVFGSYSACPPFVDLSENRHKPACMASNQAVQQHLIDNPQITTVVLTAYWQRYFHEDSPLRVVVQSQSLGGAAAAEHALERTRQWLAAQGRQVIVIGPVPVFARDVPAALAIEAMTGRPNNTSLADEQRRKYATVHTMLERLQVDPAVKVLDPIAWLCTPRCQLLEGGTSLYRDSHHLSVAGAEKLTDRLIQGLGLDRKAAQGGASLQHPPLR